MIWIEIWNVGLSFHMYFFINKNVIKEGPCMGPGAVGLI